MAHNLARWTARIGLGEQLVTTKTLRRRFFSIAGRLPIGTPVDPASATALALGNPVQSRSRSIAIPSISCLTAPLVPTHPPDYPTASKIRARSVHERLLLYAALTISTTTRHRGPPTSPLRGYRTLHPATFIGIKPSPSLSLASHPLSERHGYIPSVDSG